ncbi:EamA family transporter [Cyanobium sp. PCC 7001]|uniref:EamA family transporter n=1 Tax=Cyanobium sp. PCC 7001 TaxID=180281 RepID=UPI0005BA1B0C|nr:EamA family transporter [Cyanobium sp. PCC 7001]
MRIAAIAGPSSWVLLALGTAAGETVRDLALRAVLRHSGWSTLRVIGTSSALAALLLVLPVLLAGGPPVQWQAFVAALLLGGSLNALAFWGYGRALALEDLSLVLPLINLSPLVLLLAGWWVLGEQPSPTAALGVGLLVLGALLLGRAGQRPAGIGLHRLWTSAGCRWMLLVALLWGIGASVDKLGVRAGGSLLWVMALQATIGGTLLGLSLPLAAGAAPPARSSASSSAWRAAETPGWPGALSLGLLLAGFAGAVGTVWQMQAISQTAVVHVIALKRLSTLLGSGAGVLALGEPEGRRRLVAAALMLAGAATVLWGALG